MALVDNDVMEKLAVLELFDEFCGLDMCSDGIFLLTAARFRYTKGRPPKKLRKKHGEDALARVVAASQSHQRIPDELVSLSALVGIDDVDDGEVQLFSAAFELPHQHMLTGDKRCIRALAACAESPAVGPIVSALEGRVLCLEQIVWNLVLALGLDPVASKVLARPTVDTALHTVFASGDQAGACRYYIEDVRKDAAGMLHPFQP